MNSVEAVRTEMISHISRVGRNVLRPGPFEKDLSREFLKLSVGDQQCVLSGISYILLEHEIHPRTLIDKIYWNKLRLASDKRRLHKVFGITV